MHLRDHAMVACVGLGFLSFFNQYLPGTKLTHALWGLGFLLGNLFPDVGNYFYSYIARLKGIELNLNNHAEYEEKREVFNQIDDDWEYVHPYKWMHSLPFLFSLWMISWAGYAMLVDIVGHMFLPHSVTYFFQGLVLGCILHAICDSPVHTKVWLAWPLATMRGYCDWDKIPWLNCRIWRIASIAVIAVAAALHVSLAATSYMAP